ncbi:hypothetical protein [Nocardioides sp. TF02-7]|uniref:hypothetical protein n=1 Tax=Nocardioides sp. TF02-7 TaxID=2917724 RepID=UPI001F06EFCF|nr:hypothetical protein [Nocardioides sp. TF02-7]UMG94986.1 hypothetical protein MF408_20410 [Nocardioides sp. TF02-7]
MDTGTLAQVSNNLVYASIAVYALAMLAYAAETAGAVTVRRRAPEHLTRPRSPGPQGRLRRLPWRRHLRSTRGAPDFA